MEVDRTILGTLRTAAELNPDRETVEFVGGSRHTPAQLWEGAGRAAGVLQDLGVQPGDRVAYLVGNHPAFLWLYFGIAYAGAVSVPLNTSLRGPILRHMLETADPKVVIADWEFASAVAPVMEELRRSSSTVYLDEGTPAHESFISMWERSAPGNLRDGRPQDLAAIMFTSGTTGPSKGVMHSHNMSVAFSEAADAYLGYNPEDVGYNCLPLFHANSLLVTLLPALRAGAYAAFGERFSASNYWADVERTQATVLSLLGSMVPILWNRTESEQDSNNSARIALAVPTPFEHHRQFEERFGLRLTSLYGMTDVGLPIGVPHDSEGKPGSCGRLHSDWEARVVDELDSELPKGTPGELLVRPKLPFIMQLGYWRNPEATVDTWQNLWFHTGDVLIEGDDGWFTYVDRMKDAIRRFGENISSFEVEMVLQGHPCVAEVAVYAVPAELAEDEVMAAIVLEPGSSADPSELAEYCKERLPYFAIPRYIDIRQALPKTETAKVQKQTLRDEGVTPSAWDGGPGGRKQSKKLPQ